MVTSVLSFLDRLFCETSITTTTRQIYKDPNTFESLLTQLKAQGALITDLRAAEDTKSVDDVNTRVFTIDDEKDYYLIEGVRYDIPKVVREKPPLLINGKPNFEAFPTYRHEPFISQYTTPSVQKTYVDGHPMSRNTRHGRWTKVSAQNALDTVLLKISGNEALSVETVTFSDTTIVLSVFENEIHLALKFEGGDTVEVYQELNNQTMPASCVIQAHALVRVILLTIMASEEPNMDIVETMCEDMLIQAILAMLICAEG